MRVLVPSNVYIRTFNPGSSRLPRALAWRRGPVRAYTRVLVPPNVYIHTFKGALQLLINRYV